MCLSVTQNYNVLKEDLVVYKFLCVDRHWGITSPFRHFVWELGKTYTTKLDEYDPNIYYYSNSSDFSVESGIHALLHFNQAVDSWKWFKRNRDYTAKLFKCTIPAGSKVYIGRWNRQEGTASDALIVDRRVTVWDYLYNFFKRKPNTPKF